MDFCLLLKTRSAEKSTVDAIKTLEREKFEKQQKQLVI